MGILKKISSLKEGDTFMLISLTDFSSSSSSGTFNSVRDSDNTLYEVIKKNTSSVSVRIAISDKKLNNFDSKRIPFNTKKNLKVKVKMCSRIEAKEQMQTAFKLVKRSFFNGGDLVITEDGRSAIYVRAAGFDTKYVRFIKNDGNPTLFNAQLISGILNFHPAFDPGYIHEEYNP